MHCCAVVRSNQFAGTAEKRNPARVQLWSEQVWSELIFYNCVGFLSKNHTLEMVLTGQDFITRCEWSQLDTRWKVGDSVKLSLTEKPWSQEGKPRQASPQATEPGTCSDVLSDFPVIILHALLFYSFKMSGIS